MKEAHAIYLHGTAPEEQARLSRLNELLNDGSLREIAIQSGDMVLDVGSGLGQLTIAMAEAASPRGRVIGVERSESQLGEAQRLLEATAYRDLIEFRQGEAEHLPLEQDEWQSFDIVHARFLLEHVPDPLNIVREMVHAAKPGGRIVLEDDDHDLMRLWPEPAGFGALWNAYIRAYDKMGNDPFVGRRLVALLCAAGAEPTRNTWIFFGSCYGHPTFSYAIDNMLGLLRGAREVILGTGLLEESAFEHGMKSLDAWKQRANAAMWFGIAWAEAVAR